MITMTGKSLSYAEMVKLNVYYCGFDYTSEGDVCNFYESLEN